MRLENKVAIITGAAAGVEGQLMGFGGSAARMFANEGARVVLTDIKVEMGEAAAAQIRENGGDVFFMEHDVTDEQRWQEVIAETVARYGKLDVLVNNAGTGARLTHAGNHQAAGPREAQTARAGRGVSRQPVPTRHHCTLRSPRRHATSAHARRTIKSAIVAEGVRNAG